MKSKPMRADARRNLEQILLAARDMIAERGPDVPLDDIARRAGVGSATLYRRFPDRDTLFHAVALDALTRTAAAAVAAAEEERDPFDALARYLREALELRVSAVLPALLDMVEPANDPELSPVREESARAVRQLIADCHAAGVLPEHVTFMDIVMMLVRIARPLPGPLSAEANQELARRHLELFLRGLRAMGTA
ncbi:helix-turn-helix domain-containing protein [Nonomuraea sp. NPDC049784]|uniref:TetR/AcrR family transcriptional regulator n=1 Tax=Nonomuraea sp. NPDC049784 TaxID=3154361 RepID=UPI0033FB82C1